MNFANVCKANQLAGQGFYPLTVPKILQQPFCRALSKAYSKGKHGLHSGFYNHQKSIVFDDNTYNILHILYYHGTIMYCLVLIQPVLLIVTI